MTTSFAPRQSLPKYQRGGKYYQCSGRYVPPVPELCKLSGATRGWDQETGAGKGFATDKYRIFSVHPGTQSSHAPKRSTKRRTIFPNPGLSSQLPHYLPKRPSVFPITRPSPQSPHHLPKRPSVLLIANPSPRAPNRLPKPKTISPSPRPSPKSPECLPNHQTVKPYHIGTWDHTTLALRVRHRNATVLSRNASAHSPIATPGSSPTPPAVATVVSTATVVSEVTTDVRGLDLAKYQEYNGLDRSFLKILLSLGSVTVGAGISNSSGHQIWLI
ncbi:hypothetical protein BJ138DRAFT_1103151 [Hygrophoropsis aurantiaca]|uniref:Uncharacterized protein n=1 Tax=Hygrophoropsis aurantiaca TaxID=72124 RepID=A0ACB8A730_9AGAM|nr:hypothetical protein BJ138DRAFT_1103151 [Hygrophoropsis aurantiaca]